MQLGPAEIIVVLVIALLVFGPTRLPEVGRQVGRAMREIRKFQHTVSRDVREVFDADDEPHDVSHAAEPPPSLPPKATSGPTGSAASEASSDAPSSTTESASDESSSDETASAGSSSAGSSSAGSSSAGSPPPDEQPDRT